VTPELPRAVPVAADASVTPYSAESIICDTTTDIVTLIAADLFASSIGSSAKSLQPAGDFGFRDCTVESPQVRRNVGKMVKNVGEELLGSFFKKKTK